LKEVAAVDDESRKVARAELTGYDGLDKLPPELRGAASEADEVSARVLAQTFVYGGDEAAPEPGVVFDGEVGRVVGELLFGRGREEDFRRAVAEDGEEVGAAVGWEVEGGRVGGVED
jgi:hypothetical protein